MSRTSAPQEPEGGRRPLEKTQKVKGAWRRISPLVGVPKLLVAGFVVASVMTGVIEAALLALVASGALALADGREDVSLTALGQVVEMEVTTLLVVALCLAAARALLHLLLAYLPAQLSAKAMVGLRRVLYGAYVDAAWPVKAAQRDGHLQSLMNSHIAQTTQAIIVMASGVSAVLMFLSMLASAFALSMPTALAVVVFSVLLFVLLRPLAARLRRHAEALSLESMEFARGVQEIGLMAEEVQVFGASATYRRSFSQLVEKVRRPFLRTKFLSRAVPSLYQSMALLFLVLSLLAVAVIGLSDLATLGAVVLILVRSLTYGQQVQTAVTNVDAAVPFMNRFADAVDDLRANAQRDGGQPLDLIEQIAFDRVHLAYPGGTDVLHDVTFQVRRGEAVGVAGPSGAGKSSLVQLLLRLREPTAGTVAVNGGDVRQLRREDWRTRVAYVPQTPQVFWGTVADNIRFHRSGITDEQVERAARLANIHDEVVSWSHGYDTVIGQRASAVSGGQRQRICLARALVGDPDVLVLDEATSALDVRSEALVQEALRGLKGRVTMFVVGHRLSTLSFCDRILVMVDGRVDGFDSPAALRAGNAFFREVSEISRASS